MAKPEAQFVSSVHRHLDLSKVHTEGMANPYRGGTADNWYDGPASDLWVEWKFFRTVPATIKPYKLLSAKQLHWLTGRHNNGRNVAVIIGSPKGGVALYQPDWRRDILREEYLGRLLTRKELASWINSQVLGD